ncbi:MAG: ribosomal L7Ae/L30e/S12e/Gadd45 family protein [Clostridia bacterium]|nr:ribosomal L7Ae/L30e/S12e/Gadd45 family protein [Clostridia bacterium]MBQ2518063.1 ribosomal L7Ae/L30e/S12e/Gadd45 family protein [Clostridia bacterium]
MTTAEAKLISGLGFAQKAGKVRSGEFAAAKAVKSGAARAVVLDGAASENTKKRWRETCENAGIPLLFAENVGRAIGREAHIVACVTDNGFAEMLLRSQVNP